MNEHRRASAGLAACLLLSAMLHALLGWLLADLWRAGPRLPQAMVLTVRLPLASNESPAAGIVSDSEALTQAPTSPPAPPPDSEAATNPPLPAPVSTPPANERYYYSGAELDVWPFAQGQIAIEPAALEGQQQGGKVTVNVWIDENGKVARVAVERNDLPPLYSQLAAQALSKALFMPGMKNGHPVDSRIRIEIEFQAQP